MKTRLSHVLVRNVAISAVIALIVININTLYAAFIDGWMHRPGFQGYFWAIILATILFVALVRVLISAVGKVQKAKLSSKPQNVPDIGWPQHTSLLGALLTILLLGYGWYLNFEQPSAYLRHLLIFLVIYMGLVAVSLVWIKYVSKKKYVPRKNISNDNLIRSSSTYYMIRVCTCHKKLKGYIPLTRFGIMGVPLVVVLFLPTSVASFVAEGKGRILIGILFFVPFLFYILQILLRGAWYLRENHSVRCAFRRAYCASI